MIKTPLSTVIGGAGIWTPEATIIGGTSKTLNQLIKSLFSNGEQGFAYDPNDLSTMYQDAAGAVPVTGVGQPVGLIMDKSGRGNHASQTASASRPILRQNAITGTYYLEFDGSDDFLQTNSIDFTATDKVSLFAGVRKLSDAISYATVIELSETIANTGTFSLQAPYTLKGYGFRVNGSPNLIANAASTDYAAPHDAVLTSVANNVTGGEVLIKVNGIKSLSANPPNPSKFRSAPIYIGRRGGIGFTFKGYIYGLIGIGKLTSDSETTIIEKELAKRTGVTLP